MNPASILLIAFAAIVVWFVIQTKRAGPRQVDDLVLARAVSVRSVAAPEAGEVWALLGSETTAEGLNLRFDHDDDPQAEASFMVEDRSVKNSLANRMTIRLSDAFKTHHVHTRSYVFRVSVRGTGAVVGKEIRIVMRVHGDGKPFCGRVENDDDTDAAVGDWIEFENVEVLHVR